MPFRPSMRPAPLAPDGGLDLSEVEREFVFEEAYAAALRQDNTIASYLTDVRDQRGEIDPDFNPWEELQGTGFEDDWQAFVGTRNRQEFRLTMEQVRREREDRRILEDAGMTGFGLSLGAALFDLPSLLPGAAISRGAVTATRQAARVGAAAGGAAAAAEAALQASQTIRPLEESAIAIGGSVLLGGLLGSTLARSRIDGPAQWRRMSDGIETAVPNAIDEVNSVGAAASTVRVGTALPLRREALFQTMRKMPGVNLLLRGEPLIRSITSPLQEVRRAVAELTEVPLQWLMNERGETPAPGGSVEQRIKARRNSELSGVISDAHRIYAEYWKDGPVGMVGRITAPMEAWTRHLFGRNSKLTQKEFFEEVGRALSRGDNHPIPHVAQVARLIRERVFKPMARELEELKLLDDLPEKPRHAESYVTRIYNRQKIVRHLGDGTADDLARTLEREFAKKNPDAEIAEIKAAVDDTIRSILSLKEGEHHVFSALAKPTRARVLDVEDEVLEPWLERDARIIVENYYHSVLPDVELTRTFGDRSMKSAFQRVNEEFAERMRQAKSQKQRQRLKRELDARKVDLEGMRDRVRGVYGVPANPENVWVRAGRTSKTLSFTGFLGGLLISQIPDAAWVVGRNGFGRVFGDALFDLVTAPRRLLRTKQDILDFGGAAEWVLNSRMVAIADVTSPYRMGSQFERGLDAASRVFSRATGAVPWNVAFKSIGGVISMSRMLRAADAVAKGTATKKQLRQLSEAGIDRARAVKIARQFSEHGDKDGRLWFANAAEWQDREAFEAFRNAISRELDLMVITPGQDKPLFMSQQIGSVLLQFKSFAVSANHRILLSGMQRADADVLSGALIALALGGMVSDIKSWQFGFEPKEGDAFWADALDRSGMAGWLFEANAVAELGGVGLAQITGEKLSRFQSRSNLLGLAGPSVDIAKNFLEAANAASQDKLTQGDIGRAMNIIPANNLFYLLPLFDKLEQGLTKATGARPKRE